jgi:hypothetical protein
MNIEVVYSYLISASLFFLGSWAAVLVLACVLEFRHEWSKAGLPSRQ